MLVKELIELLQRQDPDRVVVLQKNSEGNGYSPLHSWWTGVYVPDNILYGDAHLEELTPELIERGYSEEDVRTDGERALFLYPIN
jgi:hypothetical protein